MNPLDYRCIILPELRRLPSAVERRRVWAQVNRRGARPRSFARWCGVVTLSAIVLLALPVAAFAATRISSGRINLVIVLAIGTVPWILPLLFKRARLRQPARAYLRVAGIPICVRCGYDTTGVSSARCPECGDDLDRQMLDAMLVAEPSQLEPLRRAALQRVVDSAIDPLRALSFEELRSRAPLRESRDVAYEERRHCLVEVHIECGDDAIAERVVVMGTAIDHPPGSPVPLVVTGAFVRVSATHASGSDDAAQA